MSHTVSSELKQELLDKYNRKQEEKMICCTCMNTAEEKYSKFIFWQYYAFCSDYCQWDMEHDIRKMWRRENRKRSNPKPFPEYN